MLEKSPQNHYHYNLESPLSNSDLIGIFRENLHLSVSDEEILSILESEAFPEPGLPMMGQFLKKLLETIALTRVKRRNTNFLDEANTLLKDGKSILAVSNHATRLETLLGISIIFSHLTDRKSGIIPISNRLYQGGDRRLFGHVVRSIMSAYDIQPLPVLIEDYGWTSADRSKYNSLVKIKIISALLSYSNLVFMYPEGVASQKMHEAKRGVSEFFKFGYVLPITTLTGADTRSPKRSIFSASPAEVVIHKPIPGPELSAFCQKLDDDAGKLAASDFIMSLIAYPLPEEKRGFYTEMVNIMNGILHNENIQQATKIDDRLRNFKTTFSYALQTAWVGK